MYLRYVTRNGVAVQFVSQTKKTVMDRLTCNTRSTKKRMTTAVNRESRNGTDAVSASFPELVMPCP